MSTAEDYSWLEDVFHDAACVTLVRGRTLGEVLTIFGADTSNVVGIEDAYGTGEDGFVSVVAAGSGVVAFEYNGYKGSLSETVSALSHGGATAASMFWNVNDDNAFTCAHDGEVAASVDMYDAEFGDELPDGLPEPVRALWASASGEDADLHALGVAMAAAYVGLDFSRATVESTHLAHRYSMP